jgi:distribution and morphology protein 10
MVAGCELWRKRRKSSHPPIDDDGLEWARRKMRMADPTAFPPVDPPTTYNVAEENESVLKIRVDQSWNVRLLWEGRVKELLVSAGVGLGPSSFSSSSWAASSTAAGGGQSGGGGVSGKSYWHGVGVSVSYSS